MTDGPTGLKWVCCRFGIDKKSKKKDVMSDSLRAVHKRLNMDSSVLVGSIYRAIRPVLVDYILEACKLPIPIGSIVILADLCDLCHLCQLSVPTNLNHIVVPTVGNPVLPTQLLRV